MYVDQVFVEVVEVSELYEVHSLVDISVIVWILVQVKMVEEVASSY